MLEEPIGRRRSPRKASRASVHALASTRQQLPVNARRGGRAAVRLADAHARVPQVFQPSDVVQNRSHTAVIPGGDLGQPPQRDRTAPASNPVRPSTLFPRAAAADVTSAAPNPSFPSTTRA